MKKLLIVLLCLILTACQRSSDLSTKLEKIFADGNAPEMIRNNNYSPYIDYYVPSDLFEYGSDNIAVRFNYNNSAIIMDVNVAGIISDTYYPQEAYSDVGFFDREKLVYEKRGTYFNGFGEECDYLYSLYEYEDRYLPYFCSRDVIFYGYASRADVIPVSSRIFLMAKMAQVRNNEIIAAFSSKDVIDYEKKQVNPFEIIMPVNGNINEFLVNKEETETQE